MDLNYPPEQKRVESKRVKQVSRGAILIVPISHSVNVVLKVVDD